MTAERGNIKPYLLYSRHILTMHHASHSGIIFSYEHYTQQDIYDAKSRSDFDFHVLYSISISVPHSESKHPVSSAYITESLKTTQRIFHQRRMTLFYYQKILKQKSTDDFTIRKYEIKEDLLPTTSDYIKTKSVQIYSTQS